MSPRLKKCRRFEYFRENILSLDTRRRRHAPVSLTNDRQRLNGACLVVRPHLLISDPVYCSEHKCTDGYIPIKNPAEMECMSGEWTKSQCCQRVCSSQDCPSRFSPKAESASIVCGENGWSTDLCCDKGNTCSHLDPDACCDRGSTFCRFLCLKDGAPSFNQNRRKEHFFFWSDSRCVP